MRGFRYDIKRKKDYLLREVIKPQLKAAGYKKAGENYYSMRRDCCLAIRIHSSRFNYPGVGYGFWFKITVFPVDVSKDILKGEFFGETFTERDLLSDCGFLHPYRDGRGYMIDPYLDGSPQDMKLEEIEKVIKDDLCRYILPQLATIETVADWERQKEENRQRFCSPRVKLLRYFSVVQMQYLDFDERSFCALEEWQKQIGISADEIRANKLLYKQIKAVSNSPAEDKWKMIMAALDAEERREETDNLK